MRPLLSETTRKLGDAEATRAFGASLATELAAPGWQDRCWVVGLHGDLGTGKTTLVGGLLNAFGIPGPIRSPTYTLLESYVATRLAPGLQVHHLDLYRLAGGGAAADELEALGMRDLAVPGTVFLVEWLERAGAALTADVDVRLGYTGDALGRMARTSVAGTATGTNP